MNMVNDYEKLCDKQAETITRLQELLECYEETIKGLNIKISCLQKENKRFADKITTLNETIRIIIKEIKQNG